MTMHADRAQLVEVDFIGSFLAMIYGDLEGAEGAVMLRGIGEAGTPQEGQFREQVPLAMADLTIPTVVAHARRWAQHEVATFIVPAVLDASCLEDRKGTEDKVRLYTALVVDLDTGDTDAKRTKLESALGYATMSVRSGGTTETGHPKRHLWWALAEPTAEVARVAALRERLALYAGGDPSFKRTTQIIRVPGTVHGKGGVAKLCAIEAYVPGRRYDLGALAEVIEAFPVPTKTLTPSEGGGLDFSGHAGASIAQDIGAILTTPVRAGGVDEMTRWDSFNAVHGHGLRCVRRGEYTLPEAFTHTAGWVYSEMRPPWADDKLAHEMIALYRKDVSTHGPFPAAAFVGKWPRCVAAHLTPARAGEKPAGPDEHPGLSGPAADQGDSGGPAAGPAVSEAERSLDTGDDMRIQGVVPFAAVPPVPTTIPPWAVGTVAAAKPKPSYDLDKWWVDSWAMGEPPQRRFLVKGLIQVGVPHLLAAEGGAGKTFVALDLALKLAAYETEWAAARSEPLKWWGEPVLPAADSGRVVLITSEDDKDELHIRLQAIGGGNELLSRVGRRLAVLPLINEGGAFPLVHQAGRSDPEPSARWQALFDAIAKVPHLTAVIIDTLNSTLHGEDTKPDVIQAYFNQANRICGELGAALIVTHHLRKSGDRKLTDIDDLREAVRGSSALTAAVRAVLVFTHAADFPSRLKGMGLPVQRNICYRAGVAKANNPEFHREMKTLVRGLDGNLEDHTQQDPIANGPFTGENIAWLAAAVAEAEEQRRHFTATGVRGFFERQEQLPPILRSVPKNDWPQLVKLALARGAILQAPHTKKGVRNALGIPGKALAKGMGYEDPGQFYVDWSDYTYLPATQKVIKTSLIPGDDS